MNIARASRAFAALLVCACASAPGTRATAQEAAPAIRPSQFATVSQAIAEARLELAYRRPVARGRELFGALVPWSRIWTPSADTAPVLTVSAPITVNGEALAAGTYSVWTIPDSVSWTFIFTTTHPTHHLRYREGNDALRVKASPRAGEHMETLAFYFPMVDSDSAELVMHWGKTIVPLKIKRRTE